MSYYNNDNHHTECEDHEYYYCKDCNELVHESEKNHCPSCLMFIPRIQTCICDKLETAYYYDPDYDSIRKYALENPAKASA